MKIDLARIWTNCCRIFWFQLKIWDCIIGWQPRSHYTTRFMEIFHTMRCKIIEDISSNKKSNNKTTFNWTRILIAFILFCLPLICCRRVSKVFCSISPYSRNKIAEPSFFCANNFFFFILFTLYFLPFPRLYLFVALIWQRIIAFFYFTFNFTTLYHVETWIFWKRNWLWS